ncbi:Mlp family lipoprotein [Borrelia turicatae]|uniref:Mlp family lipoprotein n=1 Tax=Borrelia turicatae TaxID=142 RepID=UPI002ED47BBF
MKKIIILIVLFLIINCEQYNSNNGQESKNRSKRDLSNKTEQLETQKTPEEVLKEKLNDSQKKGLDFLKQALDNESDFNKILSADESKIRSALDHIQSELEKCNGNEEGKKTFKQVVKGALNGGENLDNFKTQANSTCDNNQ